LVCGASGMRIAPRAGLVAIGVEEIGQRRDPR
jgi:hypothetical protein